MKRKKIGIPVIVITQYEIIGEGESQKTSESIDEMCRQMFMNYKGLIVYSSADRSWKEKLVKMLGEL